MKPTRSREASESADRSTWSRQRRANSERRLKAERIQLERRLARERRDRCSAPPSA